MKKILFLLLIISLISLTIVSAQTPNIEVKKISKGSTVIAELNNPAIFNLVIKNKGDPERFEIYSLVGVSMTPKGKISLPKGNTIVEILASPNQEIREKETGFFRFAYQIKGEESGIFKDTLLIKIVSLKDAISIESKPLHPSDSNATLIIKNEENTRIKNLILEIDSPFFSTIEVVSLNPFEEINLSVDLNKENIEEISAGPYIITAEVPIVEKKIKLEGIIEYLENEGTSVQRFSEGLVINKKTVKKTNVGNTQTDTQILIKKNIVSRLFTINSPPPTKTEREGLIITYTWEKSLSPNETFTVQSTTNYTLPFLLIILIILAGFLTKRYAQKALSINKKISFVRTKKGEFALKVNLQIKARKHVDKIQIIDTLPTMTKLYEKFGKKPDKIDKSSRRLFWEINSLQSGEERNFSYIIYSKLNIIGRFELPAATAIFEREGKIQEIWSNRAFFASEKS